MPYWLLKEQKDSNSHSLFVDKNSVHGTPGFGLYYLFPITDLVDLVGVTSNWKCFILDQNKWR